MCHRTNVMLLWSISELFYLSCFDTAAPGLEKYVEILVSKGGAQFNVRLFPAVQPSKFCFSPPICMRLCAMKIFKSPLEKSSCSCFFRSCFAYDVNIDFLRTHGFDYIQTRIVLKNGEIVEKQSLHTLDVNKNRIKLHKGRTVKAKENYSASMQVRLLGQLM